MFMEEIAVGDDKAAAKSQAGDEPIPAAAQSGPNQYGFLNGYRQLNENLEFAVTKQFKVDIE